MNTTDPSPIDLRNLGERLWFVLFNITTIPNYKTYTDWESSGFSRRW